MTPHQWPTLSVILLPTMAYSICYITPHQWPTLSVILLPTMAYPTCYITAQQWPTLTVILGIGEQNRLQCSMNNLI